MRNLIAVLVLIPAAGCATMHGADTQPSGKTPPAVAFRADTAATIKSTPSVATRADAAALPRAAVPERGARVRVVFPATAVQPERYLYGNVYRLTPDTAILAHGLTTDTVLLTSDRQLQSVVRSRNQGKAGAALGLVGGLIVGAAVASASYEPCVPTGGWFDMSCMMAPTQGELALGGGLIGGLLGGVVGYAIGSAIRTEEWGTIPLAGTRVSLAPSGLGLRIAF
jgi:hypothetical protein